MTESSALAAWQNFYTIVGSSGGALIGLQFVVITLVAGRRQRPTADALSAFGTPTVVHLGGALLISAIMTAPWLSLGSLSVVLGMCGVRGLAYGAISLHRAHRQSDYKPVWTDWIWYSALPCIAYAALTIAGVVLRTDPPFTLFAVAAVTLGLLFIGIHNAWDSATHMLVTGSDRDATESGTEPPSQQS